MANEDTSVVCDTHALVWYLTDPERLSQPATEALEAAVDSGIIVSKDGPDPPRSFQPSDDPRPLRPVQPGCRPGRSRHGGRTPASARFPPDSRNPTTADPASADEHPSDQGECGGRYRTRTCDLSRVKAALYQLSQAPGLAHRERWPRLGPAATELRTSPESRICPHRPQESLALDSSHPSWPGRRPYPPAGSAAAWPHP